MGNYEFNLNRRRAIAVAKSRAIDNPDIRWLLLALLLLNAGLWGYALTTFLRLWMS